MRPAYLSGFADTLYLGERMLIDLVGRVRNTRLPRSRPLLPLFEAVVNSIQAIEASERKKRGKVDIRVYRDPKQRELALGDESPVTGFEITDNGCGFDAGNFRSFTTSDSTLKSSQGGKGIGRFLWLKAFERVTVESVYDEGGERFRRRFGFVLDADGVRAEQVEGVDGREPVRTKVVLAGFAEPFQELCPKRLKTIGQRIVEHCLAYFIQPNCPTVHLFDGEGTVSLNDLYVELFHHTEERDDVEIAGRKFNVLQLRLYQSEQTHHRVHYCAHRREVQGENLAAFIPNLTTRIHDQEGKAFLWTCFVSGEYLDENVNPEREGFLFPADSEEGTFPRDELTLSAIRDALLPVIQQRLQPFLEPVEAQKLERVKAFVEQRAPQYRPVLKHRPEVLKRLSPNLSDVQLDSELHKARRELEGDVREESHALMDVEGPLSVPDTYVEILNDLNTADLAKYVMGRRLVLELLQRSLERTPDGSYELEGKVHQLVFPLRKTSDDVNNHNLWVIDERLAYHSYFASDIRLDRQVAVDVDSPDRPDLIAFNAPLALSEGAAPFSSVVIIEFKRPARREYSDEENPIAQVIRYVRTIRQGRATDKAGRPVEIGDGVPFYCYVMCDLTPKMRNFAEEASFSPAPDGRGYFGYVPMQRAYFEVISYSKMLDDAKKRNRAFFDKLGLPMI